MQIIHNTLTYSRLENTAACVVGTPFRYRMDSSQPRPSWDAIQARFRCHRQCAKSFLEKCNMP